MTVMSGPTVDILVSSYIQGLVVPRPIIIPDVALGIHVLLSHKISVTETIGYFGNSRRTALVEDSSHKRGIEPILTLTVSLLISLAVTRWPLVISGVARE